jgi:hypothetical protein
MTVNSHKPRIARRLMLLGASTLLGATGLSTYLVVGASSAKPVRVTSAAAHVVAAVPAKLAPRAATTPADPDTIQQGDQTGQDQSGQNQSGPQDTSGGPDTTTGSTAESTGSESDGPGGHTDPAGSAGQQGDFNN